MRKIGGPHEVVLAEELPVHRADHIVLEGRPNVVPDVIARLHLEHSALRHRAELFIEMVEAAHEMADPAAVVLCGHDFQSRKSLEDLTEDEMAYRALALVDQAQRTHQKGSTPQR